MLRSSLIFDYFFMIYYYYYYSFMINYCVVSMNHCKSKSNKCSYKWEKKLKTIKLGASIHTNPHPQEIRRNEMMDRSVAGSKSNEIIKRKAVHVPMSNVSHSNYVNSVIDRLKKIPVYCRISYLNFIDND